MHIYEPRRRALASCRQLPAELDAFIAKLLIKNPADRMPSAAYALAELERVSLMPLAAQVVMMGASGGRAPTYGPPVTGPATQYLSPAEASGQAQHKLPIWIPLVVLVVAIAIAIAAVILIGNSAEVPGVKS